jgi:hypothetical protein
MKNSIISNFKHELIIWKKKTFFILSMWKQILGYDNVLPYLQGINLQVKCLDEVFSIF